MRIVFDLGSLTNAPNASLLQVEKSPEVGEASPFNGRFCVPVPEGASFQTDELPPAYTLQDVVDQLAGKLLAIYPMYSNILYNFLMSPTDIADLDLQASPPVSALGGSPAFTRAQSGRGVGPLAVGTTPNMTAILGQNNQVAPPRPGMLITQPVDIGPLTGGAGADSFMVWWWLWAFDTDHDVISDFGGTAGSNDPAIKTITETDQEPAGFQVYISHNDGTNWTPVGRLEPVDLLSFNTDVRLAFVNTGLNRVYLAAYAVLF